MNSNYEKAKNRYIEKAQDSVIITENKDLILGDVILACRNAILQCNQIIFIEKIGDDLRYFTKGISEVNCAEPTLGVNILLDSMESETKKRIFICKDECVRQYPTDDLENIDSMIVIFALTQQAAVYVDYNSRINDIPRFVLTGEKAMIPLLYESALYKLREVM